MARLTLTDPIHFIGIGGSGMSALAELALGHGYSVTGSDQSGQSETISRLKSLGAQIFLNHHRDHVKAAKTVIYSSAIPQNNPELEAAQNQDLRLLHRSDFLNFLMASKKPITIAGTHGKTTTSAMIACVLADLGLDPEVACGGVINAFNSAARNGKGEYFVAEADESDGSFLKYRPYISVLTNVDSDHLEYYGTLDKAHAAFKSYLNHTDPMGKAIIGWDNSQSRDLGHIYNGPRLTYGLALGSEVRAINILCDGGKTLFDAIIEKSLVRVELPMVGKHNVMNALACLAVCRAIDLDIEAAARSLAKFRGVSRRLDHIATVGGIRIFDDYAHNPGKISACVSSLKEAWPKLPLHVIFQPHRYSRLATMYNDLMSSFKWADLVYVAPVYAAGEAASGSYSPESLARDIALMSKVKCVGIHSFSEGSKLVTQQLPKNGILLTVGAGDIWRLAQMIKDELK